MSIGNSLFCMEAVESEAIPIGHIIEHELTVVHSELKPHSPKTDFIWVGDGPDTTLSNVFSELNQYQTGDDPSAPRRNHLIPAKILEVKTCTELQAVIRAPGGDVSTRVFMTNIRGFVSDHNTATLNTISDFLTNRLVFFEYRLYIQGEVPLVDVYIPILPPPPPNNDIEEGEIGAATTPREFDIYSLEHAADLSDPVQFDMFFGGNPSPVTIDNNVVNFNQLMLAHNPSLFYNAGGRKRKRNYYDDGGGRGGRMRGRGGGGARGRPYPARGGGLDIGNFVSQTGQQWEDFLE